MNHSSLLSDKDAGPGRCDGNAPDEADPQSDLRTDLRGDSVDDAQAEVRCGLPPRVGTGWLHRLARALERAEQRITENFRVPPGGG